MDDFLDLEMLKHFNNDVEQVEQPEPEDMSKLSPYQGTMGHLESVFSVADDLLHALEVESLERSIEEKRQALKKQVGMEEFT